MREEGFYYTVSVDGIIRKTSGTAGEHIIFVPNDFDGCENVFPID